MGGFVDHGTGANPLLPNGWAGKREEVLAIRAKAKEEAKELFEEVKKKQQRLLSISFSLFFAFFHLQRFPLLFALF